MTRLFDADMRPKAEIDLSYQLYHMCNIYEEIMWLTPTNCHLDRDKWVVSVVLGACVMFRTGNIYGFVCWLASETLYTKRILAYWLMFFVLHTTIDEVYLILSNLISSYLILLQGLMKPWSREIRVYTFPIALKFARHLKCHSDTIITTCNLVASILHEIWR